MSALRNWMRAAAVAVSFASLASVASATPQGIPSPGPLPGGGGGGGGPVDPPHGGCEICATCPESPADGADYWLCGEYCTAVALGVDAATIKARYREVCGIDFHDVCFECLQGQIDFWNRMCECPSGIDCNQEGTDAGIDCYDLEVFLGPNITEKCVSREQIKDLICCFLAHIGPLDIEDSCETTFTGDPDLADQCAAIRQCLHDINDIDPESTTDEPRFFGGGLTDAEIDSLLNCYGCNCCSADPVSYTTCDEELDCNQDGKGDPDAIDCDDFRAFVENATFCLLPEERAAGFSDADVVTLACSFIEHCSEANEGMSPCEFVGMIVDCLEELFCRDLTSAELGELETCSGCELDECCETLSAPGALWNHDIAVSVSYPRCGNEVRCDQNCDDAVDCEDFAIFAEASRTGCMGNAAEEPLTRSELVLLACAFLSGECATGDVCSCIVLRLEKMFKQIGEPVPFITVDELEKLAACGACAEVCTPKRGRGATSDGFDTCRTPERPNPIDTRLVQLPFGFAIEKATHVWCSAPGPDLTVDFELTSDPAYVEGCAVGKKTSLSPFQFLEIEDDTVWWCGGATGAVPIDVSSGVTVTDSGSGLNFWRVPGPTTQILHKALVAYGGSTYAVWRLREPGGPATDFFRAPEFGETTATAVPPEMYGLVAGVTDVYPANVQRYEYVFMPGASSTIVPRLARITAMAGSTVAATADFAYRGNGDKNEGRVKEIVLSRPDESGNPVPVQKVRYRYVDDSDMPVMSTDVGTSGDLVLVITSERVDPMPTPGALEWRERVTHYRYHGGTSGVAGTAGAAHQIKMVVEPEQVEYAASEAGATSLPAFAASLLAVDDDDDAWTGGVPLVDLASRFCKAYDSMTGRIVTMWSSSGCGCGGGGTTQRVYDYDYVHTASDRTTITVDETPGPTASGFRRYWYEMYAPAGSGVQYLRAQATEELNGSHAPTTRAWISWFDHDSITRRLLQERSPSTFPNGIDPAGSRDYRPGTSGSAPVFVSATTGLVRQYSYVTSGSLYAYKRLATVEVRHWTPSAGWDLLEDRAYGDADAGGSDWTSTDTREHLLSRIRRYRVAGSSAADDIEETRFHYGFFSSTTSDIAWTKTRVEAELVAENGPGNWYDDIELFDTNGQNTFSIAADDAVTQREFTAPSGQYATATGQPLVVIANAAHTDLPGTYYGLSTSGVDDRSASGALALTTNFRRDLAGRIQETTEPGGISTYVLRHMAPHPWRPTLPHYLEVTLPHQWNSGADNAGAATARWMTASGKTLGTSEFTVAATSYATSSATSGWQMRVTGYTLADEVGRRVTGFNYNGLVSWEGFWTAFVADPDDAPFGGAHATEYHYDSNGRLEFRTSPNGTVTKYAYDILDRVTTTSVDVLDGSGDLPTTLTDVATYRYDGATTSTPAIGDGNLTETLQLVGASGADRRTRYSYDHRNRRVVTENPKEPHEYVAYDNLDRVTERALFSSIPTGIATTLADRGMHTRTFYSQRGLVYLEQVNAEPDSPSPTYLESHRWFDEAGRVVASWGPNAPGTKTTYDGLGRVTTTHVTDRRGDSAPGASGSYASVFASHATVLTGDVVFEETQQDYDGPSGMPTLTTYRRRTHDAATSDVGALAGLSASLVITTYSASFYDAALRPIRHAEYGTTHTDDILRTGGSAPSLGSTPNWNTSASQIVSETAYDAKGRVDSVTIPVVVNGTSDVKQVTKFVYDMADRRIATIENYDVSGPPTVSWSNGDLNWTVGSLDPTKPDVNRTTTFLYDGVGATRKLTAWNSADLSSGPAPQVTEYHYGVTTGSGMPSELNSNDLLEYVTYPQPAGFGSDPSGYYAAYAYNSLGEAITMEEGAGSGPGGTASSIHSYDRDPRGRVILDEATTIGGGTDDLVDQLLYDYDAFGRLELAESKDTAGSGTIVNAVGFEYTPLWQVQYVDQNPIGALGSITSTSATQRVEYIYDTQPSSAGTDNYSRLSSIVYPDGSVENFDYGGGSPGGPDDVTSRVTGLGLGATKIVDYSFVGLSTCAIVDLPDSDIRLDRFRRHDGGTTGGQYPGFDRYGRVKRQLWIDASFTTGSGGNPNIPPIVEILYGYDMAGNRLTALDDRPGQAQPLSHQYVYDGLQRLVEAKRGVASSGSVTTGEFSQRWRDGSGNVTLDSLGNWYQSWTDYRGDGYGGNTSPDFDQRTHEGMNRIVTQKLAPAGTTVDLGVGATPDFDYDDASNLRSHKIWNGTGTSTTTLTYKHDAWNRLVEVDFGASVRSLQGYNALHWRTCKVADAIGAGTGPTLGPNGAIDQVRLMYYDSNWRLLEERVDDGAASTTTLAKLYDGTWAVTGVDRTQQNLWGLRYIDDIVLHRADRNKDGDYVDIGTDGTWYHLTDAQFSTVCVTDDDANVVERVTYSAYGIARHHWMADVNGDGAVTTSGSTSDRGIINGIAGQVLANRTIGGSAYRAEADLDRSGVIDTTDRGLASTAVAARPDGQVSDISMTGPDSFVAWSGSAYNSESSMYTIRMRAYSPTLGKWMERDPTEYPDGSTLYEYCRSDAVGHLDPIGLFTSGNHEEITYAALRGIVPGGRNGCLRLIAKANVETDTGGWAFTQLGWMVNQGYFTDSRYHGDGNNIAPAIRFMFDRAKRLKARCDGQCPGDCRAILVEIGMLLHTLQDLYAHTDYVERFGGTYKDGYGGDVNPGEIPVWRLWDKDGNPLFPPQIRSGFYLWPWDNYPGQARHEDTNKDGDSEIRGKMKNRAGVSNFALARELAIRHTRLFYKQLQDEFMDPACRYRLRKCCGQK
jgi:RHS repeat-associated protein